MTQSRLIIICVSLLLAMLGLLFFAGAIYDAEDKFTVDAFFFEPNHRAAQRILPPSSADDIPQKNLREWLIARFVHEYFYVIPSGQNARNRLEKYDGNGKINALFGLSNPKVYQDWQKNVAPEIVSMADKKFLRTVQLSPDITEDESGYLIVKYTLQTWDKPNDVLAQPSVQYGTLYINVSKGPIHVIQTEKTLNALLDGQDPASAFNFKILDIEQH